MIPKTDRPRGRSVFLYGRFRFVLAFYRKTAKIKETLRKYVISCETLPEGLFQRTGVRLQSPLRTGFFGSDAFSQVSCALVKFYIMGLNQRFPKNVRLNLCNIFSPLCPLCADGAGSFVWTLVYFSRISVRKNVFYVFMRVKKMYNASVSFFRQSRKTLSCWRNETVDNQKVV